MLSGPHNPRPKTWPCLDRRHKVFIALAGDIAHSAGPRNVTIVRDGTVVHGVS
ncbi:hypothetical protein AB0I68_01720 [Streptomyces sp. NPDC050448]|uniref:hypothetical protein n=1 Tax=Streptomyces sp. NPDC050448 TaxID=3155404 RepID=UPI00343493E3